VISNGAIAVSFAAILMGSAMNGAYAIPIRFMPQWRWANIWALWTVLALIVLPSITAFCSLSSLPGIYMETPRTVFVLMGIFGALWGTGVLMIGKSFPDIGVAVGNAVALGSAAVLGSAVPFLGKHADKIATRSGAWTESGICVLSIGIAVCGFAGRERDRGRTKSDKQSLVRGLMLAGIGGSLTALLNVALAYGDPLLNVVRASNPGNSMAANAIWAPVLFAGGIPGVVYCAVLAIRHESVTDFIKPRTILYWPIISGMAVLWFGSVWIYGIEVSRIGRLGSVVGWPVFMSGVVIFSFLWSVYAGEWKRCGTRPFALMMLGLLLQAGAMVLLVKAVDA
jgi:L-rhamnose-H+ transport protein